MIQIADMLADESLAVDHQRDGVLQSPHPRREADARPAAWPPRRARSRGTGAESPGRKTPAARDRIVDAPRDGTLANEKRVGDVRKLARASSSS